MSESQDSGNDGEQACRRQAKIAADRVWRNFEELGERLEELALVHEDEDALQAWQKVEDTVTALDDAIGTAQEAIDSEQ